MNIGKLGLNAVGFIDKQVLPLDDAWYVEYDFSWRNGTDENQYYISNKNRGIKQLITREQAQSPEDIQRGYDYAVIGE